MKKFFLIAFVAMSMGAMAQHVTPLTIQIAEVKLDSLRALYLNEPPMYRASLDVVANALSRNADEIKAAKGVLKAEQSHANEMGTALKDAIKMASSLKNLYTKEEGELRAMQKVVENQQRTLNRQRDLNQETREGYLQFLDRQQRELGYTLREVSNRQGAISDLETAIQNAQTGLQAYQQEIQQKSVEINQLENLLKQRLAILKAEQKAVKNMK